MDKKWNSLNCISNSKGKWCGTYAYMREGKWDEDANLVLWTLWKSGHPIFRGIGAFNQGILCRKEEEIRYRSQRNHGALNLLRTIHSANQPSTYGAVSSWWRISWKDSWSNIFACGQIHLWTVYEWSVVETLVSARCGFFLVRNPMRTKVAAGKSLHDHLKRFRGLDAKEQLSKIYEPDGFMRRVSCWNTLRKRSRRENDGFGDRTGSCRDFSLSRDDPRSEVELWTTGKTEIGPVLEVKTICHLDVHGIEIYKPPRLEIIPILGWSYPEAQTATSTSCDTTVQSSLQPALKKRIMWASRKLLQNSRLLNRDLSAVNLKIIFLFKKGSGWPPIPLGKLYLKICTEICTPYGFSRKRIWRGLPLEID